MAKRKYGNAEQRQEKLKAIANFRKTGMSTGKACEMVDMKVGTYYNWVHELKHGAKPHRSQKPQNDLVVNEQTTHLEIPVTLVIPITLGTIMLKMSETETS